MQLWFNSQTIIEAKREADFSQKTKITIAYRSRHKCSNPSCRCSTMKADNNGELYSIGRACHIEATSKGGARYNPFSSPEERKSVSNAIWLCPICADMIDKDVETYPTELLKEWKMNAERPDLDRLLKEKQYKYVFIDCGHESAEEKFALFHLATDIIIPIGEHSLTNMGIMTVGKWLKQCSDKVRVWPLYSMGLAFSNKLYRGKWYQRVWKEINKIGENEKITIKIPSVIIPKSYYVGMNLDIWNNRKTKNVAEAYMDFASEFLRR